MQVILVAVVTQGVRVSQDLKGGLKDSLFARSGVLQAISVISFDNDLRSGISRLTGQRLQHSSVVRVATSLLLCSADELSGHNSLLIYGSLEKPTIDRFARVTHYSTLTSLMACLTTALAGFVTFGEMTQGNILNNFPNDTLMVNIARLLVRLLGSYMSSTERNGSLLGANKITTFPLGLFLPAIIDIIF